MNAGAPPLLGTLPEPPVKGPPRAHNPRDARLWWSAAVVLAVMLASAAFVIRQRAAATIHYVTQPIVRADLVDTVSAAGTVNPQNLISVGTQVSGTIAELDVDYNSPVKVGQIMAKIDPTTFRSTLAAASASRIQSGNVYAAGVAAAQSATATVTTDEQNALVARAALASATGQVAKARTALALARLTVRRDTALLASGYLAQNQYDTDASAQVAALAAFTAATFAVDGARAQARAAESAVTAGVAQARGMSATAQANRAAIGISGAQVTVAAYNLRQSVIVSPVNGTVIARNVSIGQTVAASFTTPTLFSIAQDLSKMEVDIAAGEPDVGGIRAGEVTDFTVLAFPNRTFHGTVYAVRQNPTTVNNVVTYNTVVYIDNADGALFPGMTANARIHVAKAPHALVVPLEALVWMPGPARSAATTPSSPWGLTTAALSRTVVAGRDGHVFVLANDLPRSIAVHIVLVSGSQAAIAPVTGSLLPGDAVVTGDSSRNAATKAAPASLLAQPASPSRSMTR